MAEPTPPVFGSQPPPPSPERQSWGAVISIVIILLMIIIGAFYAWGRRVDEKLAYPAATSTSE